MRYVIWAFCGGRWQNLPADYASYAAAWRDAKGYRGQYPDYIYVVRSHDQHPGDCT